MSEMPEQSRVVKLQNVREQDLLEDARIRGTGRARERAFRLTLRNCATAHAAAMPPTLYEEVMDHLTRTDGQGYTLCFNGPVREDVMRQLLPWLDTHAPEAAAHMRAAYQPLA
jgi:hypothetical protein